MVKQFSICHSKKRDFSPTPAVFFVVLSVRSPTFFFPVGNWIPQTVNQTWKTIAILNLSKSSTPQNVAATPFFSWKMSWSFGIEMTEAQKISSESPTFWPPKNLIPNLPSRICSIHFGNVLVEAKAAPFRFLKAEGPTKTGTKSVVLSVYVGRKDDTE